MMIHDIVDHRGGFEEERNDNDADKENGEEQQLKKKNCKDESGDDNGNTDDGEDGVRGYGVDCVDDGDENRDDSDHSRRLQR